ncbi:hypothetical protein SAMN05444360_11712 [Chryseobacterium carnipullorum]|nr:hypothetical protein SAMN05444360_11712 [Chryseobacterium carnipullorum]
MRKNTKNNGFQSLKIGGNYLILVMALSGTY